MSTESHRRTFSISEQSNYCVKWHKIFPGNTQRQNFHIERSVTRCWSQFMTPILIHKACQCSAKEKAGIRCEGKHTYERFKTVYWASANVALGHSTQSSWLHLCCCRTTSPPTARTAFIRYLTVHFTLTLAVGRTRIHNSSNTTLLFPKDQANQFQKKKKLENLELGYFKTNFLNKFHRDHQQRSY